MINAIQKQVYPELRENVSLSQRDLATASGVSRKSIQRIEGGRKLPTPEEEEAIREAAGATRLFVAELICKALSDEIKRRVTISAGEEIAYRAATPDAQVHELLLDAQEKMPGELWWAWKERIDRHKTQRLLAEQEAMADVRDFRIELQALEQARKEGNEETPPEEETPVTDEKAPDDE